MPGDWSGRPGSTCTICGRCSENVGPRRGFDYENDTCGGCVELSDSNDSDSESETDAERRRELREEKRVTMMFEKVSVANRHLNMYVWIKYLICDMLILIFFLFHCTLFFVVVSIFNHFIYCHSAQRSR